MFRVVRTSDRLYWHNDSDTHDMAWHLTWHATATARLLKDWDHEGLQCSTNCGSSLPPPATIQDVSNFATCSQYAIQEIGCIAWHVWKDCNSAKHQFQSELEAAALQGADCWRRELNMLEILSILGCSTAFATQLQVKLHYVWVIGAKEQWLACWLLFLVLWWASRRTSDLLRCWTWKAWEGWLLSAETR